MWSFSFDWTTSAYDDNNAYWLSRLSRMVYRERPGIQRETDTFWGEPNVQFYEDASADAQCCLLEFPGGAILAYRGTESFQDWKTNIKVGRTVQNFGKVHSGFWDSMNALWDEKPKTYSALEAHQVSQGPETNTLKAEIDSLVTANLPLFLCGHSLGGAMALLSGVKLFSQHGGTGLIKAVYTFGQPRSGKPGVCNLRPRLRPRCLPAHQRPRRRPSRPSQKTWLRPRQPLPLLRQPRQAPPRRRPPKSHQRRPGFQKNPQPLHPQRKHPGPRYGNIRSMAGGGEMVGYNIIKSLGLRAFPYDHVASLLTPCSRPSNKVPIYQFPKKTISETRKSSCGFQ